MKKNVAGQKVGVQMTTAADGTNFVGAVTVYVTGDAGTQAVGSVGAGACTHEGKGYHTYAPAQAETNYDLIAFTFEGTGAITVTLQVYTTFPQTGDSFGLIGATGSGLTSLASQASVNTIDDFLDTEVAAILAAVDTEVAAIKAVTDLLPDGGALTSLATQVSVDTIDNFLDTEIAAILADTNELQTDWTDGGRLDLLVDAIKAKTDTLPADPADASDIAASFAALDAKVDTIDNFLDTEVAAILADTDELQTDWANGGRLDLILDAILADTDPLTLTAIADAILKRDMSAVSGEAARSLLNAIRFLRNKWSIAGSTLTVTKEDDTTSAWTSALSTDAAAEPVTASDPA